MTKGQVAVAMSGGLDSSAAAAILKEDGYQVMGITMQLFGGSQSAEKAYRVAQKLGIAHHVVDLGQLFSGKVIDYFCGEYRRGRTPNPCITCNRYIKFDALLNKALELGADWMATGHHARVEPSPDGYRLLRGIDSKKDQSYFLYHLGQGQLRRLMLPIGHLRKADVRKVAAALGLMPAASRESQDICFIPDGDYRTFIAGRVALSPGDIVDTRGEVLGRHRGLAYYTVGQRQGLGLSSDKRLYV
ncbi:unnamed protein product, partial [marine sediment metagenome]